MVKVVFVSKDASLNEKPVKNLDLKTLHVKCNVKEDSFGKRHTWKVKGAYYSVYAKDTGRHSSENKYDLPPPVDEELYFNIMAILKHSDEKITNDNVVDLTKEEWEKTYEQLFGGFENLDDTSGEMSVDEEEENIEKIEYGVFSVTAANEPDVYCLRCLDDNDLVNIGYAYIGNIKTSILMNKLFRRVRENDNIDFIEESDDEDMFEDVSNYKFLLNTTYTIRCIFNKKYKKWEPLNITNDPISKKQELLFLEK